MTIHARFLPKYPKRINVTDGLTKTEANGVLTLGFDYENSEFGAELQQAVDTSSANAESTAADAGTASQAATDAEAARDTVLASLSTVTTPQASHADAESSFHPETAPDFVQTTGFGAAADYGAALYKSNGTTSGDLEITLDDGTTVAGFNIIQPELNQFMFGVTSDGDGEGAGTNDATAFALALTVAAARKRPLKLLESIIRLDSSITVPVGVELIIDRASLDFANLSTSNAGLVFTDGGALYGSGGALLGPGSATMVSTSTGVKCFGTFNSGAQPTFVQAPIIEGVEIANFAGYGVNFGYAEDGIVRNCKIHDIGYAGVGGVSCNRVRVRENHIKDITSSGTSNWYGAFIDRKDGTSETDDPRSYDCEFIDNIVENIAWEGLDTHGGVGFKFIGNRLKNCARAIAVVPSQITGDDPIAPHKCVVANNVIEQSGATKELIIVAGAYTGGVLYERAQGCIVEGNTLFGGGASNDTGIGAIHCYATDQLNITGNALHWPRRVGICVNFSNIGLNISGNNYVDPYSSDGAAACVRVLGTDNRGYIGGETYRYTDPSLATYVGDYSVYVDNTSGVDLVIGRSAYLGIASGKLVIGGSGLASCDLSSAWSASGSSSISVTSGDSSSSLSVSFGKRAPTGTPKIIATLTSVPISGIAEIRVSSQSATGFLLTAYASSTFGASGTLTVDWVASL